jgi:hypothetical protein
LAQVARLELLPLGSQTSSTQAFLEVLRPRWALVQADDRYCYGHPAPEVVARYEAQGIVLVMIPAAHVGLFYLTILWARPSRLDKMFWWCVVYTSA